MDSLDGTTIVNGVQNNILADFPIASTDHANNLNIVKTGGVGNTLDTFGHANLARTYGFNIEVEAISVPEPSGTPFCPGRSHQALHLRRHAALPDRSRWRQVSAFLDGILGSSMFPNQTSQHLETGEQLMRFEAERLSLPADHYFVRLLILLIK